MVCTRKGDVLVFVQGEIGRDRISLALARNLDPYERQRYGILFLCQRVSRSPLRNINVFQLIIELSSILSQQMNLT
jgi:hypothetical protein